MKAFHGWQVRPLEWRLPALFSILILPQRLFA